MPIPQYPLYTATLALCGGQPVGYFLNEAKVLAVMVVLAVLMMMMTMMMTMAIIVMMGIVVIIIISRWL